MASGGGGHGEDWTNITSQTTPGSYGATTYDQSKLLSEMMQGMLTKGTAGYGAYSDPLQQALLNPSYAPTSSSEQSLLGTIMDQTAGRGAVRGLGSPTQASLAQTIAPTLVGLRQSNIQNLMGARQQDLTSRGLDMNSLLQLIQLSMPKVATGQRGEGWNTQFSGSYGGNR